MNEVIENGDGEKLSLTLPLKKKDLGDFISSLLGQQQSMERDLSVKFDIDHHWLINLHELIDQRIKQQQDGTMIEFIAIVHFDSGLSRSITAIEAFNGYNETKKDTAIAITMLWSYLIKFPGRSFPEKQEISFNARLKLPTNEERNRSIISVLTGGGIYEKIYSNISYDISHTERTWGDDIDSLILNHVNTAIREEGGLANTLYNYLRWSLAVGLFVFCTLFPVYFSLSGVSQSAEAIMTEYQELASKEASLGIISLKVDSAVRLADAIANKDRMTGFVLLMLAAPFLAGASLNLTRKKPIHLLSCPKQIEQEKKAC